MKKEFVFSEVIDKRVIDEAKWIVDTRSTMLAASKHFGVSKTTISKDMHIRLKELDGALYNEVHIILEKNKIKNLNVKVVEEELTSGETCSPEEIEEEPEMKPLDTERIKELKEEGKELKPIKKTGLRGFFARRKAAKEAKKAAKEEN